MKKLFTGLIIASVVALSGTVAGLLTPAQTASAATNSCRYTNLNRGESGYCVRMAQTLMKGPMTTVNSYSGYSPSLSLDGSFGPATQTAAYKYQRHYGLKYDGVVGPQTWRQLCNPGVAPYVGSGPYVRAFNYAHSVTCS